MTFVFSQAKLSQRIQVPSSHASRHKTHRRIKSHPSPKCVVHMQCSTSGLAYTVRIPPPPFGHSFRGEVSHRQSCKTALLTVGSFPPSEAFYDGANFHTVTMLPRRRKVTVEAQVASFTCKYHTYWKPGRRNLGLRVFVGENFNKERLVDCKFLLNFFFG